MTPLPLRERGRGEGSNQGFNRHVQPLPFASVHIGPTGPRSRLRVRQDIQGSIASYKRSFAPFPSTKGIASAISRAFPRVGIAERKRALRRHPARPKARPKTPAGAHSSVGRAAELLISGSQVRVLLRPPLPSIQCKVQIVVLRTNRAGKFSLGRIAILQQTDERVRRGRCDPPQRIGVTVVERRRVCPGPPDPCASHRSSCRRR